MNLAKSLLFNNHKSMSVGTRSEFARMIEKKDRAVDLI